MPSLKHPAPEEEAAANLSVCVAALYKFAPLNDCVGIQEDLIKLCRAQGVKGTLILAAKGSMVPSPDRMRRWAKCCLISDNYRVARTSRLNSPVRNHHRFTG